MLYVTCIEMLCIVNCVAVLYNLRRISNASYPDLFLQISLLILLFLSYYYVFVTQCQFSVFFILCIITSYHWNISLIVISTVTKLFWQIVTEVMLNKPLLKNFVSFGVEHISK